MSGYCLRSTHWPSKACCGASRHFFSTRHVIYPLLRPAMEDLFDQFRPAFVANAGYRFRNRKQFWPISAHDHLLLKSDRARVVRPRNTAYFSVRDCLTASPAVLEARLRELTEGTVRMACINYLETVVDKVPDTMRYLSKATGPAAPFEKPPPRFWPAARKFRRSWIRRIHRIS
jgi:hypothetical protein